MGRGIVVWPEWLLSGCGATRLLHDVEEPIACYPPPTTSGKPSVLVRVSLDRQGEKESAGCSPSAALPTLTIIANGRNPVFRFCSSVASATWLRPRCSPGRLEICCGGRLLPRHKLSKQNCHRFASPDDPVWRRHHEFTSAATR
ncbi:hypothetical protein MRX96_043073 [Rhipicephalus microplus]